MEISKNSLYDESMESFPSFEDVYEKTTWAIENGLSGVMTFANHCDLPANNEMP